MQTPPPPNNYVAGFAFNPSRELVLLRKAKPKWQAGKLNGIGGSIEPPFETAREAMVREFREETSPDGTGAGGLITAPEQWTSYCTLSGPDWRVEFFFTQLADGRPHRAEVTYHLEKRGISPPSRPALQNT